MGLERDLDSSFVQFIKDVTNCLPICYIPLITDVSRNSTGMYIDQSLGNFFHDDFVSTNCGFGSKLNFYSLKESQGLS